jgi:hypothetical protein
MKHESIEAQHNQAYLDFRQQQDLLEAAEEWKAAASNRLGRFVATIVIRHRERTLYASDEHLGMIEAMQAVRKGMPTETALRTFGDN